MRPKHVLEFILVWSFDRLFWFMPEAMAVGVSRLLAFLASRVMGKRNALVKENLRRAFPDKSKEEINQIAAEVWANIGRTAVEFIRLPKLKNREEELFTYLNSESVLKAQEEGKGVVFVTFHFSNWEMGGVMHQTRFRNLVAIARPMKNPLVEKWVQSKRKFCGMEIILHRQAVRQSLKVLRLKKAVAILADQNLYTGGVFSPFFGRPAATTTLPALLHLRTRAPIIIAYSLRTRSGYEVFYSDPLRFPELESSEESVQTITDQINQEIESVVRAHPGKWFWVHNRWKRAHEVEETPMKPEAAAHE